MKRGREGREKENLKIKERKASAEKYRARI